MAVPIIAPLRRHRAGILAVIQVAVTMAVATIRVVVTMAVATIRVAAAAHLALALYAIAL